MPSPELVARFVGCASLALALALAHVAAGCERDRRPRADQQIGLIDACERARRECLAASDAEREQAITRWLFALQSARGLCTNDLHDALVLKDDRNHRVALQLLRRTDGRELGTSFLSDLGSDRLTAEQQARVVASLRAISGEDFGDDRAAWEAWLRRQH